MLIADFGTLQSVMAGVDARYEWTPNALVYAGGADFWPGPDDIDYNAPHIKGDCKVHALLCRYQLRQQDIDSRIMICLTEKGGIHCVLEVDGWILDNRHPQVQNRDDLKYTCVQRSGIHTGDPWHLIEKG